MRLRLLNRPPGPPPGYFRDEKRTCRLKMSSSKSSSRRSMIASIRGRLATISTLIDATQSGGPVLDLGCGTGMLACGIAAKGLNVTAVDPAEAMLRIARTRPGGDKVNWIQSDGQSLRLPQRFNFIYMTGHAIQQLLTDDDAVGLLRAAADHLLPDGRFVFETRNPAAQAWLSWTPEHSRAHCPLSPAWPALILL